MDAASRVVHCCFLTPWPSFPPSENPVFPPLFSAFLKLFPVCLLTGFPENFACFLLRWHWLSLPHMFPVDEKSHISFSTSLPSEEKHLAMVHIIADNILIQKFVGHITDGNVLLLEKLKSAYFQLEIRGNT